MYVASFILTIAYSVAIIANLGLLRRPVSGSINVFVSSSKSQDWNIVLIYLNQDLIDLAPPNKCILLLPTVFSKLIIALATWAIFWPVCDYGPCDAVKIYFTYHLDFHFFWLTNVFLWCAFFHNRITIQTKWISTFFCANFNLDEPVQLPALTR